MTQTRSRWHGNWRGLTSTHTKNCENCIHVLSPTPKPMFSPHFSSWEAFSHVLQNSPKKYKWKEFCSNFNPVTYTCVDSGNILRLSGQTGKLKKKKKRAPHPWKNRLKVCNHLQILVTTSMKDYHHLFWDIRFYTCVLNKRSVGLPCQ